MLENMNTSGCGHCKKLAPALSEAAAKIKDVDDKLVFAKVYERRVPTCSSCVRTERKKWYRLLYYSFCKLRAFHFLGTSSFPLRT